MTANRQNRPSGFTLLELLVVVSIIVVSAGMMLAYSSTSDMAVTVNSAAREVSSLLRSARQDAIQSGRQVLVARSGSTILAYRDEDGSLGEKTAGDVTLIEQRLVRKVLFKMTDGSDVVQWIGFTNKGYLICSSGRPTASLEFCVEDPDSAGDCEAEKAFAKVDLSVIGMPKLTFSLYSD